MDIKTIAAECVSLAKYACSKAPDGQHCWIYYHGEGRRICTACDTTQPLWADRTGNSQGIQAKAELGRYIKVTPMLDNGTPAGQAQDRLAFLIKAADWMRLGLHHRVELMQELFGEQDVKINGWHLD